MHPLVTKFIEDLKTLQPGERLKAIKEFGQEAQTLYFAALDEIREKMRAVKANRVPSI